MSGDTCIPVADSCSSIAKTSQYYKVTISQLKLINFFKCQGHVNQGKTENSHKSEEAKEPGQLSAK